jgi:hypothetical protein
MPRAGDIGQLTIKKVNQNVTSEADFSRMPKWVKEAIATSGQTFIQWTKQNQNIEGVKINVTGAQRENLLAWQEEEVEFFYKTANKDSYSCTGEFGITDDTTRDGSMTITIMPTSDWSPLVV